MVMLFNHGRCYLTSPIYYTVMTLFHVGKLAYKVNGKEMKVFAHIDIPYQQQRCPHSEYDLPLTRQTYPFPHSAMCMSRISS